MNLSYIMNFFRKTHLLVDLSPMNMSSYILIKTYHFISHRLNWKTIFPTHICFMLPSLLGYILTIRFLPNGVSLLSQHCHNYLCKPYPAQMYYLNDIFTSSDLVCSVYFPYDISSQSL